MEMEIATRDWNSENRYLRPLVMDKVTKFSLRSSSDIRGEMYGGGGIKCR